LIKGLLPESD